MYTYKYRHDLQEGKDFVYVKGVLAGIPEALAEGIPEVLAKTSRMPSAKTSRMPAKTSRMPSAKTSRMPYFADLSANQPMITGLNCRK